MTNQPQAASYRPDIKITELGEEIGDPVAPAEFPKSIIRYRNNRAAASVGLDQMDDNDWSKYFGRLKPLKDNLDPPLALRYHGHQFRVYNPEIGDGRGFLFAQMRDEQNRLLDLGTKGSGTTPWSRSGDGKLTLKGGVREILATEMLEALGVDTSKSFSLVETGEELWRNDEPSPTRSALMLRLSHSHVRFGTFQRIAYEQNTELMEQLVRYCLDNYYDGVSSDDPAVTFFNLVTEKIAKLAASYMVAGFVHGVLNTDNINITGESFDYGPWRFTPKWDARFTAAYFDQNGLYAFGRQPEALHWNLSQLAASLRLITEAEPLIEALERFPALYQDAITNQFCWRLGIKKKGTEDDRKLIELSEKVMVKGKFDIDQFFFRGGRPDSFAEPADGKEEMKEFAQLISSYEQTRSFDHEYWSDDKPCSMHIEEVESIWDAVADNDDWQPFYDKIANIRRMGDALREQSN